MVFWRAVRLTFAASSLGTAKSAAAADMEVAGVFAGDVAVGAETETAIRTAKLAAAADIEVAVVVAGDVAVDTETDAAIRTAQLAAAADIEVAGGVAAVVDSDIEVAGGVRAQKFRSETEAAADTAANHSEEAALAAASSDLASPEPPASSAPTASEGGAPGPGAAVAEAYKERQRRHQRHQRGQTVSAPKQNAPAHVAIHALLEVVARAIPAAPALAAILAASVAEGQKRFAMDAPDHLALASVNGTATQVPQDVSNQSWLQRMEDALVQCVVGIVLAIFSIPVLWFNERRAARMESIVARGRDDIRTISADKMSDENRGKLVHVQDGQMKSTGQVLDRRFDVTMKDNCVRLRSSVEVFQNVERVESRTRTNNVGGGSQTVKQYYYTPGWHSTWHDSSKFHPDSKVEVNVKPAGLDMLGDDVTTCDRVEYGSGFVLDEGLVSQCTDFQPVLDLGEFISLPSGSKLRRSSEHKDSPYYYLRMTDPNWTGHGRNQIGDTCVQFSMVRDGPATVVALQGESDPMEASRGRFLPYRLVKRPWFGNADPEDDAYKTQLLQEGMKTRDQLAEDERCNFVLCCCCNLVAMCCAMLLTPELHHLIPGSQDVHTCFRTIERQNKNTTAGIRILGWLMMFAGLVLFFSPLTTLISIIPFLGPIMASVGQFVAVVFSFIVTLAISMLIMVVAYAAYRPLTAILYAVVGVLLVAAPILAVRAMGSGGE